MLLTITNLRVAFGALLAVSVDALSVEQGTVVGIAGPNGSGKSSLLNALTGLVSSRGLVMFDESPLKVNNPAVVYRRGVLRTFQQPQVVPHLTCLENVLLAERNRTASGVVAAIFARPLVWRLERARWARAMESLERTGLAGAATLNASQLTAGQQRFLELSRVINGNPKLILLDEPTAGLNDSETEEFTGFLRRLQDDGVTIVVVEHKIDFINRLCERVVLLELGRVIADGTPNEVWSHPDVIAAYLGIPDATS
jgi:ABC-type branched-subunit amino acid transport system ATPase component